MVQKTIFLLRATNVFHLIFTTFHNIFLAWPKTMSKNTTLLQIPQLLQKKHPCQVLDNVSDVCMVWRGDKNNFIQYN